METLPSSSVSTVPMFELNDAIKKVWKEKKLVVWSVVICTLLAVVISLLLPLRYTATATILPESKKVNYPDFLTLQV